MLREKRKEKRVSRFQGTRQFLGRAPVSSLPPFNFRKCGNGGGTARETDKEAETASSPCIRRN